MCHTYDITIKNGDDGDPVRSSELKLYGLTRASIKTVSAVLGTAVETAGLPSYPRRGFSSCLLGTQPMVIPGWVHLDNDPHVSQPTKTSLLDSHDINDIPIFRGYAPLCFQLSLLFPAYTTLQQPQKHFQKIVNLIDLPSKCSGNWILPKKRYHVIISCISCISCISLYVYLYVFMSISISISKFNWYIWYWYQNMIVID